MIERIIKKDATCQKVWDYIRRNPVFRAGDILMVIDLNRDYLSSYLVKLAKAQFLRQEPRKVSGKNIEDNEYALIRNTGVQAPRISSHLGKVYDPNTKKYHSFRLDFKREIIFTNLLLDKISKKHKVRKLLYEIKELKTKLSELVPIAQRLDDKDLNIKMMQLGLYPESDPESKEYDEEYVRSYIDENHTN